MAYVRECRTRLVDQQLRRLLASVPVPTPVVLDE